MLQLDDDAVAARLGGAHAGLDERPGSESVGDAPVGAERLGGGMARLGGAPPGSEPLGDAPVGAVPLSRAPLSRAPLIDALDRAFRADVQAPERQHYAIQCARPAGANAPTSAGSLLIMPAWQPGGCIGVKLVTVFPGNAALGHPAVQATYALFDATSGLPLAVMAGTELTRRRTAAASALAARYLAISDASRLLMVGTGALAPHLIESHAAVRPIGSVRVWGRRLERAEAVAKTFAGKSLHVTAVADLEAAVRWADIISCATLAETPLVYGRWLRPGQHVDLVGSFRPEMREADDEAMRRAHLYVDTREGAMTESGELVRAMAAGLINRADIRGELRELARGICVGRRSAEEITLFKSVGSAVADLAAAELVLAAGAI